MEEYYHEYFKTVFPKMDKTKFLKCIKKLEKKYSKYNFFALERRLPGNRINTYHVLPNVAILNILKKIYFNKTGNYIMDIMIRANNDMNYRYTFISKTNKPSDIDTMFKKRYGVLVVPFSEIKLINRIEFFKELPKIDEKYFVTTYDPKKVFNPKK